MRLYALERRAGAPAAQIEITHRRRYRAVAGAYRRLQVNRK
jgi:hypothetical protein